MCASGIFLLTDNAQMPDVKKGSWGMRRLALLPCFAACPFFSLDFYLVSFGISGEEKGSM